MSLHLNVRMSPWVLKLRAYVPHAKLRYSGRSCLEKNWQDLYPMSGFVFHVQISVHIWSTVTVDPRSGSLKRVVRKTYFYFFILGWAFRPSRTLRYGRQQKVTKQNKTNARNVSSFWKKSKTLLQDLCSTLNKFLMWRRILLCTERRVTEKIPQK